MSDDPPPSSFGTFALDPRLCQAIANLGFENPTPVQSAAMPALLEGRDVIGRARTGSGKTAAFGLPMLHRLQAEGSRRDVRGLVLAPTRELALQVGTALRSFAKHIPDLHIVIVYGGAPYPPQLKALRAGATIVVGTPGRLIDHMERKTLDLSKLEILVLDEADEMLRMGFIDEVEKLLAATPESRQCALFSATMPDRIRSVAQKYLKDPATIEVEGHGLSVDHIDQEWIYVPHRFKLDALVRVLRGVARGTTLVFARTRASCGDIADRLIKDGFDIDALHGDLTQAARERVMRRMRSRRLRIVIATDVAARGLDVEHIEHVINFDMPDDAEIYVHRIGRTGRAGRAGTAITFVTPRERGRLRDYERRIKSKIAQSQVPSDSEIARVQQDDLQARLVRTTNVSLATAFIDRVLSSSELEVPAIAAAAMTLLAEREGISLESPEGGAPPTWAMPPEQRKPRRPRSNEKEVQLFFPVGRNKGVRPKDLVGLLANEAGIPGSVIGRIDVFAFKSFVTLPESVAKHVLSVLRRVSVRGVDVPVALAHPREPGPPPERPSRKFLKPSRKPRPGFKRKKHKRHD